MAVSRSFALDRLGSAYLLWCLALGVLFSIRALWSWPDATWLSQLWFIEDIHLVVTQEWDKATWFDIGGGQSTNGYRWFAYLNAMFFGLNSQLETLAYAAMMTGTAVIIGHFARRNGFASQTATKGLLFAIPLVLLSLPGSLARGMELGTYAGLFLFTCIVCSLSAQRISWAWATGAVVMSFSLYFIFLGGYALGVTLSLAIVALLIWKAGAGSSPRLILLTGLMLLMSILFTISLAYGGQGESSKSLEKLFELAKSDLLFIPNFLSVGFAGGLVTNQVLERFGGNLRVIIPQAISLLVLGLVLWVLRTSWKHLTTANIAPLVLICYAPANYLMLLLFRPNDQFQLLNPWYSLHSKFALVGLLWLALSQFENLRQGLRNRPRLRLLRNLSVSLICVTFLTSNAISFERQNFERDYFLNIALATLDPSSLKNNGELTPLVLNYADTIRAITILRDDKLGVYRDVEGALLEQANGQGFIKSGSFYSDGWMGKEIKLQQADQKCKSLRILATKVIPGEVNSIVVEQNGSFQKMEIPRDTETFTLAFKNEFGFATLRAERTWSPELEGINQDERFLSFNLQVACIASTEANID